MFRKIKWQCGLEESLSEDVETKLDSEGGAACGQAESKEGRI